MDGTIKISYENAAILKGMNLNYLTSTKDHDYRFVSRLLTCVFKKNILAQSCLKRNTPEGTRRDNMKYKELYPIKFGFVRG